MEAGAVLLYVGSWLAALTLAVNVAIAGNKSRIETRDDRIKELERQLAELREQAQKIQTASAISNATELREQLKSLVEKVEQADQMAVQAQAKADRAWAWTILNS